MADGMTSAELLDQLEAHYIKPGALRAGGLFVRETGINGAWGSSRRCDALYVGFTSASGRRLVGHELKVSRSDWLRELNKPHKADTWADGCHQWYVVAPDTEVVQPQDLPPGWGLMVPKVRGRRFVIEVKARVRDIVPPWDVCRSIMARQDTLLLGRVEQARDEALEEYSEELDAYRRDAIAFRAARDGLDGSLERIQSILEKARAELREQDVWRSASDEEIVAAIVDQAAARSAAQDLRRRLQSLVLSARDLAQPFTAARGELERLLVEAEAACS